MTVLLAWVGPPLTGNFWTSCKKIRNTLLMKNVIILTKRKPSITHCSLFSWILVHIMLALYTKENFTLFKTQPVPLEVLPPQSTKHYKEPWYSFLRPKSTVYWSRLFMLKKLIFVPTWATRTALINWSILKAKGFNGFTGQLEKPQY